MPYPQVSVCIPYWQRQAALDQLTENYGQLYGELPLEFSICDDGSAPPVAIKLHSPRHIATLTTLPSKRGPLNPCVPINHAVAASHGTIIVLTNPEVLHPTPLLFEMLSAITHDRHYIMAPCRDTNGRGWLAGPQTNYGSGGRFPIPPGGHFHFCVALPRTLWQLAGGFDNAYRYGQACDDNDWLWRLAEVDARFHTIAVSTLHTHTSGQIKNWGLPHNGPLFAQKWPEARRAAILARRGTGNPAIRLDLTRRL